MTMFSEDILNVAHKRSIFHKTEILNSDVCGCFYCLNVFKPSDIIEWVDTEDSRGQTALCPKCAIDAVLGSSCGYPVTDSKFLEAMHKYYF